MAWQAERRSICKGCGYPRDLTHDEAHQHEWVAVQDRCHACEARDQHVEVVREQGGSLAGMFFGVERRG